MCIPYGATGIKSHKTVKKDRPKKHIERVSQREFEKGDPNFVDERTKPYKPKKEESFLDTLIKELEG